MMRSLLFLSVLAGCSPLITEPDRANCVRTVTYTDLADDSVSWTRVTTYDDEFREVAVELDWVDNYVYTAEYTYNAQGCQTSDREITRYESGRVDSEIGTSTCDDNGDRLTRTYEESRTVQWPYAYTSETEWDREYGKNGLTTMAIESTSVDGGEPTEAEVTYAYDRHDRVVREARLINGATNVTSTVWYDETRSKDLQASEEFRDSTAFVRRATYNTFDDKGRVVQERSLNQNGEALTDTVWEEDRWAPIRVETMWNGEPYTVAEAVTSDEDPYLERTIQLDGQDDPPDGVFDYAQHEVWDCP